MLKKILRKLNQASRKDTKELKNYKDVALSSRLNETTSTIKSIVGESDDVIQREIMIAQNRPASLFYIKGLSKQELINKDILKPLLETQQKMDHLREQEFLQTLLQEVITNSQLSVHDSFDDAITYLMSGDSLLVIEGIQKLIILNTRGFDERSVQEPQSEVVIRGPRDGFIENLQTNIVLIRRRLSNPDLIIQMGRLGEQGRSPFALAYIKGIANEDLIEEVRYRLACVETDDILETGVIEQLIEDNVLSPFPQLLHTERPDKAVGALLNGQIIILVEGTPFVLIAPITFHQLFKSSEDYYERWYIGTLIRILRYFAAFISLFLPAIYIAMVSYHQGMIPTPLALSTAGAREGVPFPAFVEAILMEITIELLREAGVRLPRPVGQTIGIVGGLVIGDAAVRAGFVSPIMVIVVALTAVSSFAIPAYSVSITFRFLRFMIMVAAAIFGLYGIILVFILLNVHLVGLRSFGSYYTSPFAPYHFIDWLDSVFRAPMSILRYRTAEPRKRDNAKQKLNEG
ncbi:spore germination protein [Caldalkalibacillus mannanilyticus]|uniref:spore germination protein n=1 Tax=Caldalkalibacillus mannanilyticus TaxID=1418 RepID=UPI0005519A92|nr:spore germination protein [Caldalkalibacillus mannanilyticus]